MYVRNNYAVIVSSILLTLAIPFSVKPQDDDSKAIKAEVFINTRPQRTNRTTAKYRPITKPKEVVAQKPPPGTEFAQLGLTLWRFRRSKATDKTKELVEEDDGPVEWTLERVPEGTLLTPGQRVRLSFESLSRTGYVYVVDREEYADGTFGEPILIYPTQKTVNDNHVEPGKLVYIPSAEGRFIIKPSDSVKKHVAESITIIVSAKPLLAEDQLGPKSIRLPREQFETWQRQWEGLATKYEMEGGPGQTMTVLEQSAAKRSSQLLTQADPVPQTVLRLALKPDTPIFITVPLRFAQP